MKRKSLRKIAICSFAVQNICAVSWRHHSRVLFVYIYLFLSPWKLVTTRPKKQVNYWWFRLSGNLSFFPIIVLYFFVFFIYFAALFLSFGNLIYLSRTPNKQIKRKGYHRKVGWDTPCVAAVWSETDSEPRANEESLSDLSDFCWGSHGDVMERGLDLLTWRATLPEVCSHNSNSYLANKVEAFKAELIEPSVIEKSALSRVDLGDTTPAMDGVNFAG